MGAKRQPNSTDEKVTMAKAHGVHEDDKAKEFERLVSEHEKMVYSIAYRMLNNHADAKDISQEVFFKLYINFESCKAFENIKSWIGRVTTNVCIDQLRKRKPIDSLDAQEEDWQLQSPMDGPELSLEKKSFNEAVDEAISRLPDELRAIIIMREMEGYGYSELAEFLRIPIGTVKSRISRARQMLRQALIESGTL